MLEYKNIEYGELLQRCAYGEIDAYGHRFNVGNYVVVFHNARGVVCIARVYDTVSELHKGLLELTEEFKDRDDVDWDVYRVVPTRDDDEEHYDECEHDALSSFTVLVPCTEFPYREFSAALAAGLIEDTADCYGMDLLRDDFVLLEETGSNCPLYRMAGSYSFVSSEDTLDILKRMVSGAKLLHLS